MATLITVAGADFSANALAIVPPAIAGLKTWCLFGTDLAHSQNLVPGGPALTPIGTPTYGANYVNCTPGTNNFDTNLTLTTGGTAIVAAKVLAPSTGVYCLWGNYFDSTHGLEFAIANGGAFPAGLSAPGNLNTGFSHAGIEAWGLYAISFANGVAPVMSALTLGTSSTAGAAGTYNMNGHTTQVGGSPTPGTSTATSQIAFLAQYQDVALSSAQIASLVPSIRAALAAVGITV